MLLLTDFSPVRAQGWPAQEGNPAQEEKPAEENPGEESSQRIRYVKAGGTGDGTSWASASGDLQAMIDAADVEQVWTAGGTFKPSVTGLWNARAASFRMKNGVSIFGGFIGNETSLNERPAVNPVTNTPSSTTLSGDIGTLNDNSDNSYHVVMNNSSSSLNSTAVLDGFVITSGNANTGTTYGTPVPGSGFGGGIWNENSSPTLVNCSISTNSATDGGGIWNVNSNPALTNCILLKNVASNRGGGIWNENSSPTLVNCNVQENSTKNGGGGIYNRTLSSPTLTNCSLISNSASKGGGIYNTISCSPTLTNCSLLSNSASSTGAGGGFFNTADSRPKLVNCVLWSNGGNKTIYNDGGGDGNPSTLTATFSLLDNTVTGYNTDGEGNKTTITSPFASGNGVTLAPGSPAIDAGSNQAYTTANGPKEDLTANDRFFPRQEGSIDIGAVESQTAAPVDPPTTSAFAITGATTTTCQTVSAGLRTLTFTPQYSGLNGQPIRFSVVNELNPTTAPGPYTLKLYTDNPTITLKATQQGTSGEASFTYNWLAACNTGSNPPANQAPTTTGIPNQNATVGQPFSLNVAPFFSDPNGDALSYQASGLPNGLSLSGSTISGNPSAQGTSTITVTATDPGNQSVSTQFTLTVNPVAGGNPPTAAFAIIGVTTVSCVVLNPNQRRIQFTPRYAGQNGQSITFSVVNELSPTTAPGPYTLSPYTDNPTFVLKATQSGTAGEVSFTYNWLAACSAGSNPPANQAPTTTGIPNQNATVGQPFSLNVAPFFSDPNGDALSYQASGLPNGLSLSGSTISGNPSAQGTSTITVTATDPGNQSVSTQFTLTVNPVAGGNPPTAAFAIIGVTTVSCTMLSVGQRQLQFTPQYSGTNGQPISFSVVNELLPTTTPGPYSLKLYTDNPSITLVAKQGTTTAQYTYNWLAACNANKRIGVSESASQFRLEVLGNPVQEQVRVLISGAEGKPVRLRLMDLRGRELESRVIEPVGTADEQRFDLRQTPVGMLMLQAVSQGQTQVVKIIRQ